MSPHDELLARFDAGLSHEAFTHRCAVTFPAGGGFIAVLRETYQGLTGLPLPEHPVKDAYLSDRGDGIVQAREPRGFTIGMGETLTYWLLVAGDVSFAVEDWWEDNIAGPETLVFKVRARSAERLMEAVAWLEVAVRKHGSPWEDPFPRAPKRADRSRVEAAVRSFTDPALAWAALAPPNPRWTFVEALFRPCPSCDGAGIDRWFGGACYGCGGECDVSAGFPATPHPPSMADVIAFGSDLPVMHEVAAAWLTLLERLAPWGRFVTAKLEWHRETSRGSSPDQLPKLMVPIFEALRAALGDISIPTYGSRPGWFSQCSRAWQDAAHLKPFSERLNPFEPLRTIVSAGYRPQLAGDELHGRLRVDG